MFPPNKQQNDCSIPQIPLVTLLRSCVVKASLTVEAAFSLPIFFFGLLILVHLMTGIKLKAEGDLALSNRARAIASAAGIGSGLASVSSPSLWVDLSGSADASLSVPFFPGGSLFLRTHARVYPWIGYEPGSDDAGSGSDDEMVYVTNYASVYHTHGDCTHLDLSIYATTTSRVGDLRNDYGERYKPCDGFPKDYTGVVYVTTKGDRYYPTAQSAGLTRHVSLMKKSELGDLPLCERCGSRHS